MTTPGEEIAGRLAELGLPSESIVRALMHELGLTAAEAEDAMRAARARSRV